MNYPKTILNLIESFKKLPGIGEKTAERLALSTLNMDDDTIEIFSNSLKEVKNKIKKCEKCGSYTEEEICDICKSETRDHSTMCVVEESKNVIQFEKVGTFNETVNPENINLNTLKKRIKEENIKEVILAIKPSIEGETTVLYISKMLEDENIKITKIAHGIPMGADIDYIDPLTLEIAMEDRTTIS